MENEEQEPYDRIAEIDGNICMSRIFPAFLLRTRIADTRTIMGFGPVGQDGYYYQALGSYSHPFVPYISRTTGEPNGGCDQCGWAESIHSKRPTHIRCEDCGKFFPIPPDKDDVGIRMDEDYGVHSSELPADFAEKIGSNTISRRVCISQRRFFCSESCLNHWLQRFPWPREWEGLACWEVEQKPLDEHNQPVAQ